MMPRSKPVRSGQHQKRDTFTQGLTHRRTGEETGGEDAHGQMRVDAPADAGREAGADVVAGASIGVGVLHEAAAIQAAGIRRMTEWVSL